MFGEGTLILLWCVFARWECLERVRTCQESSLCPSTTAPWGGAGRGAVWGTSSAVWLSVR